MKNILVIAYGNPLRCDDGIAWQAAEEIRRVLPSAAEIICVHQLTPELAEAASRADLVIFLDATTTGDPGSVLCQPISAESGDLRFSHSLTPRAILAICDRLYSAKPRGFLISLRGECFDHGERVSPTVINAIPLVVAHVSELVGNLARASETRMLRTPQTTVPRL